jgi:NADH:ubiquinone oxidoreductase subunit 6 (subunit J)
MSFMEFVIGVIAMIAAIGVVGCRNPLYSAFSLIVHLLAVAGLYALLALTFWRCRRWWSMPEPLWFWFSLY